jgi:hypothetical protein
MVHFTLELLGRFRLTTAGTELCLPTRKAEALLAYLALSPARPHVRETLTALFWGERGDAQACHSLSQTLFSIRKVAADVGAPTVVVDGRGVALDPASVGVDAEARATSPAAITAGRDANESRAGMAVTLRPSDALQAPVPRSPRATRAFGREAEVRYLQGCLEKALAGTRQVVFVSGEGGLARRPWSRPSSTQSAPMAQRLGSPRASASSTVGPVRRTCRCWKRSGGCAGRRAAAASWSLS